MISIMKYAGKIVAAKLTYSKLDVFVKSLKLYFIKTA